MEDKVNEKMNEGIITVADVLAELEKQAPYELAEEWDNVGLLVGNREQTVSTVYLALDACKKTIDEAVERGADLVLTHHPFIFAGMKKITTDDAKGRQLMQLILNNISLVSAHTNEDRAQDGLNAFLAEKIGVLDAKPCQNATYLRIGELKEGIDNDKLVSNVQLCLARKTLSATNVTRRCVKRVGVFTGKVDAREVLAHKSEFDALVCGELGYHTAMEFVDEDVFAIECGHFGSEFIFCEMMSAFLKEKFPEDEFPSVKILTPQCDYEPLYLAENNAGLF